jgi:hypothetical protein
VSQPGSTLPSGNRLLVPIEKEAGLAPEPVWAQGLQEKSLASAGNQTPIAGSSSHYSDTIVTGLHGSSLFEVKIKSVALQL